MYTKSIPFHRFDGKPDNKVVHFNLTEREVFKLLPQLQAIFSWKEKIKGRSATDLPVEEVIAYYNNFEDVLLEAWGVPSEDGLYFRKAGRFEFEESALFSATMVMFVTDPTETGKLLEKIMPKGLTEIVEKADKGLEAVAATASSDEDKVEIERMRARLAELEASETNS